MSRTKRMLLDVIAQLAYIGLTFAGLFLATKSDLHYVFRLGGVFVLLETISRYVILHIQIKSERQMEKYAEKCKDFNDSIKKYEAESQYLKDLKEKWKVEENKTKEDKDE